MLRIIANGATGASGHQMRIDNAANNLANINTTGYKKQQVAFADLLYREIGLSGRPVNHAAGATAMQGSGTAVVATPRLLVQGAITETGRPLDLLIEGAGYFRVQKPGGEEFYTRDGSFYLDREGQLVNSSGYSLLDGGNYTGALTEITISSTGLVTALNGEGELFELGQLSLYRFTSPTYLEAVGENLFRSNVSSGPAVEGMPGDDGFGMILQGALETSNVDAAEEMTDIIASQRSYQLNLRTIKAADEMWSMANNLRK